jgi:hypothetical protein
VCVYLSGKKDSVADSLSRLDIIDLKIQGEETLPLLFEYEYSSIKFLMHTALIVQTKFEVQRKKDYLSRILNEALVKYNLGGK